MSCAMRVIYGRAHYATRVGRSGGCSPEKGAHGKDDMVSGWACQHVDTSDLKCH